MGRRRALVVPVALCLVVTAVAAAMALGASSDTYLHTLLTPPRCAAADSGPPTRRSQLLVGLRALSVRQALTSQSVLVGTLDEESSQADCAASMAGVETVFTVDGVPVSTTTVPCRFVPQAVDNQPIPVIPGWVHATRYVIPADSLTPGTHALGETLTYTVDVSYSLGCDDPSGRCTTPAGPSSPSTRTS